MQASYAFITFSEYISTVVYIIGLSTPLVRGFILYSFASYPHLKRAIVWINPDINAARGTGFALCLQNLYCLLVHFLINFLQVLVGRRVCGSILVADGLVRKEKVMRLCVGEAIWRAQSIYIGLALEAKQLLVPRNGVRLRVLIDITH